MKIYKNFQQGNLEYCYLKKICYSIFIYFKMVEGLF